MSGRIIRNSQLGQVLFCLTTIQLQTVQLYLKDKGIGPLHKALGIFTEQGRYICSVAFCSCLHLTCPAQNKPYYRLSAGNIGKNRVTCQSVPTYVGRIIHLVYTYEPFIKHPCMRIITWTTSNFMHYQPITELMTILKLVWRPFLLLLIYSTYNSSCVSGKLPWGWEMADSTPERRGVSFSGRDLSEAINALHSFMAINLDPGRPDPGRPQAQEL